MLTIRSTSLVKILSIPTCIRKLAHYDRKANAGLTLNAELLCGRFTAPRRFNCLMVDGNYLYLAMRGVANSDRRGVGVYDQASKDLAGQFATEVVAR